MAIAREARRSHPDVAAGFWEALRVQNVEALEIVAMEFLNTGTD